MAVSIMGCKLGSFPILHLGMLVSYQKIIKAQLRYVEDKTKKRLGTWQCEFLSSGGKSTLIDSCLSSVPKYTIMPKLLMDHNPL